MLWQPEEEQWIDCWQAEDESSRLHQTTAKAGMLLPISLVTLNLSPEVLLTLGPHSLSAVYWTRQFNTLSRKETGQGSFFRGKDILSNNLRMQKLG